MHSFQIAILSFCICATVAGQAKQDEINKIVDELSLESANATIGLESIFPSWDQVDVAAELLRREVKVRETAEFLALLAVKDPGRGRFRPGNVEYAREAFYSLGPRNTRRVSAFMVEWLESESEVNVEAAGAALLRMEEPGAEQIPLLVRNLSSPMVQKRIWACKLLTAIGEPATAALANVRPCMKDADESVRREAAKLVGMLDKTDRECVRVLANRISDDKELTRQALRGLESLGPRAVEAGAKVVPLLTDYDTGQRQLSRRGVGTFRPGLRGPAQDVLDAMGPRLKARVLLKWLDDPGVRPTFRRAISAEILSSLAFDQRLSEYFSEIETPPPVAGQRTLFTRGSEKTLPASQLDQFAIRVIRSIDSPSLLTIWLTLDKSPTRQVGILSRFSRLGGVPPSARHLLPGLLESPQAQLRVQTLWAIARTEQMDVSAIIPLTASEHQPTRLAAAAALGSATKTTRTIAIRHLKTLLADKDLWVRTEACVALHELNHPADDMLAVIQPILADRSHSENEQNAALRVVETLGPAAAPVVSHLLVLRNGDLSSRTLTKATAAIGPAAVPGLMKHLRSSRMRRQAVIALGLIGPPARRAIPTLVRLQPEPTTEEATELARAIALIQREGEIALLGIRRILKTRHQPSMLGRIRFDSVFDLIVELGAASRPLIPVLSRMVEVDEFQPISNRLDAAYALAAIDPNEPKWRAYLESHDAIYRLADLDEFLRDSGKPSRSAGVIE